MTYFNTCNEARSGGVRVTYRMVSALISYRSANAHAMNQVAIAIKISDSAHSGISPVCSW